MTPYLDLVYIENMNTKLATRSEAEALLQARGIQPTPQRIEVLYRMHEHGGHLSADDLYARMALDTRRVSRATVYNTLQALEKAGIVRQIVIEPNRVLYDAHTEPHHHFYNEVTCELTDIPSERVGFLCLPILPEGTSFAGVDVVVRIRPDGNVTTAGSMPDQESWRA